MEKQLIKVFIYIRANRLRRKIMTVYINKENEILEVVCDQFATNPLEEYCLPIRFASCCNYTMTEDQKYSGLDELLYPNLQTSEEEQEKYEAELDGYDSIVEKYEDQKSRTGIIELFDRINSESEYWAAPIFIFEHGSVMFSTANNGMFAGFAYLKKSDDSIVVEDKEAFYKLVNGQLEMFTEYCNGSVFMAIVNLPDGTEESMGDIYSETGNSYYDLMKALPRGKDRVQHYELQSDIFGQLGFTSNKWAIAVEKEIKKQEKYLSFEETMEQNKRYYK